MRMSQMVLVLVGLFAVGFIGAEGVLAQDCGTKCKSCTSGGGGPFRYEGYNYHASGENNMTCCQSCFGCTPCPPSANEGVDANEVAEYLSVVGVEELSAVVAAYGERLMLQADRNLVLIKGTSCGPDVIGAMVVVSAEKGAALLRANVPDPVDHLALLRAGGEVQAAGMPN